MIVLSEVLLPGKGEIELDNCTSFYTGGVKDEKGVALVLRNYVFKQLTNVECYSVRLVFVNVSEQPVDILLVQVYTPTTNHDDDEIEKLYEEISEILHQEGRGQVNAIVMVNFNSIGRGRSTDKVVGPIGLGKKMRETR